MNEPDSIIWQDTINYKTANAGKERIIMAVAKKDSLVAIRPIEKVSIPVRIVGDTPLITHCWDAKAKRQILEKELGFNPQRSKSETTKNPAADFASSMYWLTKMPEELTADSINEAIANGAKFGFPLTGIKQAAISSAFRMGWSKDKVSLQSAFFIQPNAESYYAGDLFINYDKKCVDIIPNVLHYEPMVEIHAESVIMREDMVTVGMGSADIRYRAQFNNWYADFVVSYNANGSKTIDEILTIINAGGYGCGIGEWRPEKTGQYGMYHIETVK